MRFTTWSHYIRKDFFFARIAFDFGQQHILVAIAIIYVFVRQVAMLLKARHYEFLYFFGIFKGVLMCTSMVYMSIYDRLILWPFIVLLSCIEYRFAAEIYFYRYLGWY